MSQMIPLAEAIETNRVEIPDFDDTAIAFQRLSMQQLRQSYRLFKLFQKPWLVKFAPNIADLTLRTGIPFERLFSRAFKHFCGGQTMDDCGIRMEEMQRFAIGTILDYASEQLVREEEFEATITENIRNIEFAAKNNTTIPFCVFKPTGIMSIKLLEKVSAGQRLSGLERAAFQRGRERFAKVCAAAEKHQVRLFVDAEETWTQFAIDSLVDDMMRRHNKTMPIIFNTVQMYRTDRLNYLNTIIENAKADKFFAGFKIVRGAYMEKERERASRMKYPSPIYTSKEATDAAYDAAIRLCIDNREHVSVCAATHNERSTGLLTQLIAEKKLSRQDPSLSFAQLFGMGDHLTFNLAHHGFNVAKYMPYGRIKQLLPYLARRVRENSAIQGQTARELLLIEKELQRRSLHSS